MKHFLLIFALLLFAYSGETAQNDFYEPEMVLSNALPVQFWIAGTTPFNERNVDGINKKCWCQPFNCDDDILVQFQDDPGGSYNLIIRDEFEDVKSTIAFTEIADGIYEASFNGEDENICNDEVRLIISDGSDLAQSDCLSIRTAHRETNLIAYSNHRNFAGIDYASESPDPTYYIRVPSRFFHERYPEEDETIELSRSVVATSAQQKTQRLFEVIHAPYYFHQKLKLVLKHQRVEIDGVEWEKEESYDLEVGNKRWALKSATCWLTQTNSIVRNVL